MPAWTQIAPGLERTITSDGIGCFRRGDGYSAICLPPPCSADDTIGSYIAPAYLTAEAVEVAEPAEPLTPIQGTL